MSFLGTLGNLFPSNTIAHKIFDKGDSLLNKVVGGVTKTDTLNNVTAAGSVKQAGLDVISAYSTNLSNAIKGTSAGISGGAIGSVQQSSTVNWILNNWFIIIAGVVLFLILKRK